MQNFHHTNDCPIRDILTRIGEKWPMLVLVTLHANGTMRFSDIQKSIADISQRMLTVPTEPVRHIDDNTIHASLFPERYNKRRERISINRSL